VGLFHIGPSLLGSLKAPGERVVDCDKAGCHVLYVQEADRLHALLSKWNSMGDQVVFRLRIILVKSHGLKLQSNKSASF
jgi:hypothetical protein